VTRPIAVVGPTGTGKSVLALELAERLGGEIVNADAMQLYRGMDIGTAKLPAAERRGIPHHQLDVLDVTETATVAGYQQAAAAAVEAIAARGAVPIIVGGSMLYIQSLLDDWAFPATDPQVRARWEARLAEVGVAELHAELARRDQAAAATILPTDGRRIVRALEVVELTGLPFAASAPAIGAAPRWDTLIIGLDWDTAILDERLVVRTDAMFDGGLVDEVRALLDAGLRDGVTASRALGYAQVLAALDAGEDDDGLREARELTFIGTRRYVRRQRSWFRRDHRITWRDGAAPDNAPAVVVAWRHVS
jgi:tRNA dimethylallyltransferase